MFNRRKNRDTPVNQKDPRPGTLDPNAAYTASFAVRPPTVKEKLTARRLELLTEIKRATEDLDIVDKQLEWLRRFPEADEIIRAIAPGAFR